MEAAVDYKQYGKLDAMKDIIDSRGNDKLTKKIPRRTILKNKITGGDPFILANNGKPAVVKQSDVNLDELEKIFKDNYFYQISDYTDANVKTHSEYNSIPNLCINYSYKNPFILSLIHI